MNSEQMHSRGSRVTRRRRMQQGGSILILGTLTILVLFGFMGLAFDASYMYFYKRRMQTAADAGALAGAQEKLRDAATDPTTAARNDTALNGFTNATNGITVTVNSPPTSGTHTSAGFVEVIVSQPQPTWFMRVLNVSSATVAARAVAGIIPDNSCVFALNRTLSPQSNGVTLTGNSSATFACGVYSNSNFRAVGGGCLSTGSISYTGDYTNASSGDPDCGPGSVGPGVPVPDPLASKYVLPLGIKDAACDHTNYNGVADDTIIYPGIYCGGIKITTGTRIQFMPGPYYLIDGGLTISTGGTVKGLGVTFYSTYSTGHLNKYSGFSITGAGQVTFSAPTSGPNKALLFWGDPDVIDSGGSNGSDIQGGANSAFQGIIYLPTTDLKYAGNSVNGLLPGTGDGYTMIVAYNLEVKGGAQVNADYSSIGTPPIQRAVFAE